MIVRTSAPVFSAASTATARIARVPSVPGVVQLPVYGAVLSLSNWFHVPVEHDALAFEHDFAFELSNGTEDGEHQPTA